MQTLILLTLLALSLYCRGEETVKKKRGIFGEGLHGAHSYSLGHNLALGGPIDLGHHLELGHNNLLGNYGYGNLLGTHSSGLNYGNIYGSGYGYHGGLDLGSYAHKHITITNKVGVPFPQPYPVHIEKKIPIPIHHPVPVPVDKPYVLPIPQPYPVPVEKPVPYTVVNPVPYPVAVPFKAQVNAPASDQQSPPQRQPNPFIIKPAASIGSGSLGVVRLPSGNYALGSGSLGYTGARGHFVNNANNVGQARVGSSFGFGNFNQNFARFGNPLHAGYEGIGKLLTFGHQ